VGTSGQAGRLFVSTRTQSMLPLAAHASRPLCSAPFHVASLTFFSLYFIISLLL
jgi:hypothetical protein